MRHVFVAAIILCWSLPGYGNAKPALSSFEILKTGGPFHGDEIKISSTDGWFALTVSGQVSVLVPVALKVTLELDPIVDEDEKIKTGKVIAVVPAVDHVILLIKGPGLKAGTVKGILFADGGLRWPGQESGVSIDKKYWRFSVTGSAVNRENEGTSISDHKLNLHNPKLVQVLNTSTKPVTADGMPALLWAGDLNQDGVPDVLLNETTHYNVDHPVLYISSESGGKILLKKVAELVTTGC